jgi:hypothetical protein
MPFGEETPSIIEGVDGVRRFDDPTLQSDVAAAFKMIPANHNFAVIPHLTLSGPRMTAVCRMGDTFSISMSVRHDWTGWTGDWKQRGAAELSATWSPF